jgi:hypothetical protein
LLPALRLPMSGADPAKLRIGRLDRNSPLCRQGAGFVVDGFRFAVAG